MCQEAMKAGALSVAKVALIQLHTFLVSKARNDPEDAPNSLPVGPREGTVLRVSLQCKNTREKKILHANTITTICQMSQRDPGRHLQGLHVHFGCITICTLCEDTVCFVFQTSGRKACVSCYSHSHTPIHPHRDLTCIGMMGVCFLLRILIVLCCVLHTK
jgi:hypothetical protein